MPETFDRQQSSHSVLVEGRTETNSQGKMENQLFSLLISSFQQRRKSQLAPATWNSLDQSCHAAGKLVQILGLCPPS